MGLWGWLWNVCYITAKLVQLPVSIKCRGNSLSYVMIYMIMCLHMFPERLENVLTLVDRYITKRPCRKRPTNLSKKWLVVTLRYPASGDSQQSSSFNFHIGRTTISKTIRETNEGICPALSNVYLKAPESINEWLNIANEFEENLEFPKLPACHWRKTCCNWMSKDCRLRIL